LQPLGDNPGVLVHPPKVAAGFIVPDLGELCQGKNRCGLDRLKSLAVKGVCLVEVPFFGERQRQLFDLVCVKRLTEIELRLKCPLTARVTRLYFCSSAAMILASSSSYDADFEFNL
jgi:hypothetical protein